MHFAPEVLEEADFGGYKNRHSVQIDVEQERRKLAEIERAEQEKKTYSVDFMLSLRDANKTRPLTMALLDFPHKKRLARFNKDAKSGSKSDFEKFNETVGEIRILLNKLSASNFEVIQKKLI